MVTAARWDNADGQIRRNRKKQYSGWLLRGGSYAIPLPWLGISRPNHDALALERPTVQSVLLLSLSLCEENPG